MANVKFTEFPSAATVGGTDIIPIVQGGINKKATGAVFSTYIGSAFVALTGNQTIAGVKTFSSQLVSTIATGTAPFSVASTTKVTNLNADLLDGLSSAAFQTVLTNPITGTGTTNYLPKFTGASALGNSLLQETTNAIGLNVTPKAWGNNNKVFETTFSTSLIGRSDFSSLGRNFFYNSGDDPIYSNNGFASGYFQADGEHLWVSAASGTAGNTISFAQTMTLKANGQLLLGTTTSGSYKLDVNGTARVKGIATIEPAESFQNAVIKVNTLGSVGSTGSYVEYTRSGVSKFYAGIGVFDGQDTYQIGVSSSLLTLASTGAATFASSVTANRLITKTSDGVPSLLLKDNLDNAKWEIGHFSNDLYFYSYGSGTIPFTINYSSGAATFSKGLGIGGASGSASGIEFPATQVASASANNLDDYEEGTWTMGLSFGNGTTGITYSSNTGNYVKIGKQVTVTGYVEMTNKGSSTGTVKITGLPFTVAAATANYSAPSFWTDAITFTVSLQGYGNVSGTTIDMLQISALGIGSALTDTNFANNSRLMVTLTYFV